MEISNLYYGYIYKITIPTSKGSCYYWGQHKYTNYPNIDLKYWGSGVKLTNWVKKHLGKQARPGRLNPDMAIKIGLKREIVGWYKSLKELNNALGKTRWTNSIEEKFTKECPGKGWVKGRLPGIMCSWWNNGIIEIYTKNVQKGLLKVN